MTRPICAFSNSVASVWNWSSRRRAPLLFALAVLSLAAFGLACNPSAKQAAQLADPCAVVLLEPAGSVDAQVERAQQQVREAKDPSAKLETLGWLFVSRARTTHDPGYYKLAEQSAACIEKSRPESAGALLLRGHVQQNLHRFREAEQMARRLVAQRESPFDYGLLGDALMEQGRLDEAATAYQKMVDLRPGIESYSRAAHLRWLVGDLEGATALMRMAARAGGGRNTEPTAWAYSRLAHYELQSRAFESAWRALDTALDMQPEYAPALLGQGRLLLAKGQPALAIEPLTLAARRNPVPEYQWLLADALHAAGRYNEAARVETEIERHGASSDPRTFSLYLATREQHPDTAVRLAKREMSERSDVFSYDALAWSLHAAGETQRASEAIKSALSAGTQDARLFLHAAVIAAASGDAGEAARFRKRAESLRHLLLPSELAWLSSARPTPRASSS